jgi:tetratricopeptide (TPR) repeat protein
VVGSRTTGSRSVVGTRTGFGATGSRSVVGTRTGFGATGSRSVVGTRTGFGVTGGRVSARPGTRAGRSYRITDPRRLWGGGYYHRWALPLHRFPYYARAYPRFGLYFGYGVSYYTTVYAPYFVDAVPYAPYDPTWYLYDEPYTEVVPPYGDPGYVAPYATGPGAVVEPEPAPDFPEPLPGEGQQPLPHPDFEPGLQAFLAGDYGAALERFSNVLQAEPDNGEAWLAMAHANFAIGRYAQAAKALAEAGRLEAFPRGYRFDPRPLYPQEGRFDALWLRLRQHAAARPADADAQLLVAYFHVALGERGEAYEAIERVLQARPDDETAQRLALALLPPPSLQEDGQTDR